MDTANRIIEALTRIQERADLIRHGGDEVHGGLSLAETHCVHWAGSLADANVTRIAGHMGMTRGAISKMTRKLQAKGLLETRSLPDNNKEFRFVLTPAGHRVFESHLRCHAASRNAKHALLCAYTQQEQEIILSFLDKVATLAARNHDNDDSGEAGHD